MPTPKTGEKHTREPHDGYYPGEELLRLRHDNAALRGQVKKLIAQRDEYLNAVGILSRKLKTMRRSARAKATQGGI